MRSLHILLLLILVGWLGSDKARLLAQETTRSPLTPPAEETTRNLSEPPTPKFLQVEVNIGAGGPGIQVRSHPDWVALYGPHIRLDPGRTEPTPEAETAPLPEGEGNPLRHTLEQALNRVQPPAAASP